MVRLISDARREVEPSTRKARRRAEGRGTIGPAPISCFSSRSGRCQIEVGDVDEDPRLGFLTRRNAEGAGYRDDRPRAASTSGVFRRSGR